MKKFLSTLALALVSTMTLFAQTTLVATLTKGTETTSYYGIDAFKEAVEAAADGDLITLSPGTFNATTLNKSITIRGAGTLGEDLSTHIIGEVSISTPAEENPNHRLAIYGVYLHHVGFPNGATIKNLLMEKCAMHTLSAKEAHLHSMTMIQCLVTKEISIGSTSSVNCINCIISTPFNWAAQTAYLNFRNCIVLTVKTPHDQVGLHYFNSILVFYHDTGGWSWLYSLPASCTLQKSIVTGKLKYSHILFNDLATHSGQYLPIEKVFKQVPATYIVYEPTNDYALTDSIATNVLGEDGTQIGIYGGVTPYSQVVRYPRFTKFNVDAQASEEGKLKVEVEVAVGE